MKEMSKIQRLIRYGWHGISFGGLLTIILIGLKLFHIIALGWIWVLFPLWLLPAITLFLTVLGLLGMLVISIMAWLFN